MITGRAYLPIARFHYKWFACQKQPLRRLRILSSVIYSIRYRRVLAIWRHHCSQIEFVLRPNWEKRSTSYCRTRRSAGADRVDRIAVIIGYCMQRWIPIHNSVRETAQRLSLYAGLRQTDTRRVRKFFKRFFVVSHDAQVLSEDPGVVRGDIDLFPGIHFYVVEIG